MRNYFFILLILFMSCDTTESVEQHDDNAVLQSLLNIADSLKVESLINEFDIDEKFKIFS